VVEKLARDARTEHVHTAGFYGPGATTRASMRDGASRSSASWSNRAKRSSLRCIPSGETGL